ncbi:DUF11 domain-containing protein [Proteobacteria bacterium 005FR1]|nr:DUF11 domain-containing protein [Proteobacteria bacterium 005FR1]
MRTVVLSSLLLGFLAFGQAAQAAEKFCSDAPYFGVIDGSVLGSAPTQITIDTSCTFKNWPTSKPLSTNINFQTNDPSIYLIIFDNVFYTGNMACANIPHKLWVVNSREDAFSGACQDIIIPPETIDKQSPVDTIGIGEQFTYRLVLPSMGFPAGAPSPNDIGDVIMTDNLDALGAKLTLVGTPSVTFAGSGLPVPHTFTHSFPNRPGPSGGLLTFEMANTIVSGQQLYVDITVQVDDDPVNVAGTQIVNTAEWEFSRSIDLDENGIIEDGTVDLDGDGIIEDEFFNPLPGESGIASPITIAEPSLVVRKTSNQTALNIGVTALFIIEVENVGGATAWDLTLTDLLPNLPGGPAGMCDTDPGATVTAEIFEADGVTSASGPLVLNTDFAVNYTGSPACEFSLTTNSAKAAIGPSQRLVVTYESQLDPDTTADTEPLTNVAGADMWYSGPGSVSSRRQFDATITDGSPGLVDFQDNYTITTALSGYYFEKTATNVNTDDYPALTATLGDTIEYRLRLFNVDQTIDNIIIRDTLDPASFDLASFSMVNAGGASYTFDSVSGELVVDGGAASLDIAQGEELSITFRIDLLTGLGNGDVVENQASIHADQNTADPADDFLAVSDDPFTNGVADPTVEGDEDPTPVTIQTPGPLSKATTQSSAAVGERFSYIVTVPETPINSPLYDVRILDDLSSSSADLVFVSATDLSGNGWALVNTGTASNVVIEDTSTGIDIPAGEQATVRITVELQNTETNRAGLLFANTASYTYNRINNQPSSRIAGGGDTAGNMAVVEPQLAIDKSLGFVSPAGKTPTDPATVGDVLRYQVTLTNNGDAPAYDVSITDSLPQGVSFVTNSASAEINGVAVVGFVAAPDILTSGQAIWGELNEDGSLDIPIGQSLVLSYRVSVEEASSGEIINSAVAEWTSRDGANAAERSGAGCPTITSPDDYCVGPATASVSAEDNNAITKTVVSDSYAESPASSGDAVLRVGDTVTYSLTLNLQEYTTRSVLVEDVLPIGMEFVNTVGISPTSGSGTFSFTVNTSPAAGDRGLVSWDLGDVVNTTSNDDTPVDQLVIDYTARVLTDAAPVGVGTANSYLLTNNASLSYVGGDPASYPDRLSSGAVIEVRQPAMSAITKTDLGSGRTGTGTAVDPFQVDILNDTMSFELLSCNNGLAPAYGVVVQDQFPVELDENFISPPVVTLGAAILTEGIDYTLSLPARGGQLQVTLQDSAPIAPQECLSIRYALGFHSDITPFSTWNNQASLSEYRSLPLAQSGRIYRPTDTARVYMTNQLGIARLAKTLMSAAEATVGDEVVYELVVPAVPVNASLDNVVVRDALHPALEYLGATATDAAGNPWPITDNTSVADQVSLELGTIPAGKQVVISLRTRVLNNSQANAGVSFSNTADYRYSGLDPAADTSGTSAPLTLVEPELAIAKSVVNVTTPGAAPMAGEVLRYRLTFTANGGASGDNYSDAYDLRIEDSLGLGLLYIAGSTQVDGTGNSIADPVDNGGDGINNTQTLTWDLATATADIDVAEGSAITVSYEVRVLDGVQAGQDLGNSATVQWTGQNGDSTYERDGSRTPAENDYVAGPATTTVTSRLEVNLQKTVVNQSSGQNPGVDAAPGDVLHYTLVLTNGSMVPITNGVFTDDLASAFQAGTLELLEYPADATIANTDAAGGSNGTGLVDIRNLTVAAQGDPAGGDRITIAFSVQLAGVLDSGTAVLNTGRLSGDNLPATPSNTTTTTITSAPLMRVEKTSEDLTNDPASLQPGDTLRYTITVRNVGNENAADVSLSDLIPTYASYVAGSTTLNGATVADPAAGVSPLQDGMLIQTADSIAGAISADVSASEGNLVTVTFDVTIDTDVVGGTVISNQAYVNGNGAGSGAFAEMPSDDPATATVNDPTVDVVGDLPLLDAHKTVELLVDHDGDGLVDPGDLLRYTIVISNRGAVDATDVHLVDAVPAYTAYRADSTTLNGLPVGQPDGGISPLAAGVPIYSADGADSAVISAGGVATVMFEVLVDAAATPGTVISNQGVVSSAEQDDEPTDADGIDSNGDQPTTIVVGNVQMLSIIKEVFDVNGGVVLAGDELEYLVTVRNVGSLPATDVVVRDNLNLPEPSQLNYQTDSARLNGNVGGLSFLDPTITADYSAHYGDLAPGAILTLRFRASVNDALATGTTVTNTASVYWDGGTRNASASASVVLGAPPGYTATLGGSVWHDTSDNKVVDSGETLLENWAVELYRNSQRLAATTTNVDGQYRFVGLPPNDTSTTRYSLRFLAPGAGVNTATLGIADSPYVNGPQRIDEIVVSGNAVLDYLNLPILPNGLVYDSISRVPVNGAMLTMVNAASQAPLPASCFDDPAQQGQVTLGGGFYRFDINFSDPSCQTSGSYLIQVTEPSAAFEPGVSRLIPPQSDASTPAFDVAACLGSANDANPATPDICEVVALSTAPPASVEGRSPGTHYNLHLMLNNLSTPGQSQLFNNHIALDPVLDTAVTVRKIAGKVNVSRGDLVPYTISIENAYLSELNDLTLVDIFPPGFRYVKGSARLNGVPLEPELVGAELQWKNIDLAVDARSTLELLLIPGAGVSEGEYINHAQVRLAFTNQPVSNTASATVRVVADPTFDCSDIIGKVFEDRNANGYPDAGEPGVPGARVVSARGLMVTADRHGRFHLTCAAVPNEQRGSNFILKLDERSLPSGYRTTTENPRVVRLTRGKAVKLNFGTALHRVIRLDVANGVFEANSTTMRPQWTSRIDSLMSEMQKAPSILRLSYLADVEDPALVQNRVKLLKRTISERWQALDCCYKLDIETEIFWRRGGPPDQSEVLR